MTRESLADSFDDLCGRLATRVAIRAGDTALSFAELRDGSQALTRVLQPLLRQPGTPAVVLLPNSDAFVSAFFAIARAGGVVAPLNPGYRCQELRHYLDDLEPAAIVTSDELLPGILDVMPSLHRTPAVLAMGPARDCQLVRAKNGPSAAIPSASGTPLLLQYTSGSTGNPKKVVRSHAALLAELAALQSVFATSESDRFLGVTPFSYVNGLVRTMLSAMYVGATLYPLAAFRRREMLDLLSRERLTFWGGVPQMFAVLGQTAAEAADLSSLRVVFSSSAPLLAADHQRFRDRYGHPIRQLYGSTETGTISVNTELDSTSRIASVGRPLPGVGVEVLDPDDQRLAAGGEGQIVIKSPFAAAGYLENPGATAESFRDGWYFTGDIGHRDADGFLFLTGRQKLLLNRGGLKVNPYEVEEAIAQHPLVEEVVVFGSPGPHGDDVVCCVVVPAGDVTIDDILAHCRQRIADYKIPSRVELRDSLPRAATGKVLRARL